MLSENEPNVGVYIYIHIYIYAIHGSYGYANLIFCDLQISMCFSKNQNKLRKVFFPDLGATTIPLNHVQVHVKSQVLGGTVG